MNKPCLLSHAWLYIAIDIRNLRQCKIGITTRESPITRIREGRTSNPYYLLFTAYNLSEMIASRSELENFERHAREKVGTPVFRVASGNNSEWRYEDPRSAELVIEHLIINSFQKNGNILFDEDGLPNPAEFSSIKHPYRPDPFGFSDISNLNYNECKEYIDFLMDFHNYPAKPINLRT